MGSYQCPSGEEKKKKKMAPAPRGRLVAVATHNIIILADLMFLRFRQRNRRTRVRSEYARHILRNRHILGEFHQLIISSMIIQCRKILHCNDKLLFIVDHLLDVVGSIKLGIFES